MEGHEAPRPLWCCRGGGGLSTLDPRLATPRKSGGTGAGSTDSTANLLETPTAYRHDGQAL
eukprot:4406609-Alexandrium_andersonii.AAC.1